MTSPSKDKAVLEPQVLPAFAITYFGNHCNISPTPMVIHSTSSMWIQWLFFKNLTKRSITPRWPLTPLQLRSQVWLYPRIIVSTSHENMSKYVDTVTLFFKTWTKGHWPLDDLWPHICWGHMCDSTQGSLCPSSMGIHQCMWIQWSILQNFNQDYLILHTYYRIHSNKHPVRLDKSFWVDAYLFQHLLQGLTQKFIWFWPFSG